MLWATCIKLLSKKVTASKVEAILVIVGFLGAGKTTLLKKLIKNYIDAGWNPYIILNDYENAYLDAQQLTTQIESNWIKALKGSCICCSGIAELREFVNRIPKRTKGITIIEANGTSDACSLMGFLGVGIDDHFLPPIQISVVDVNNWQQRGQHNELEANQIQVSSLIVLTHVEDSSAERRDTVVDELKALNPSATILTTDEINIDFISTLVPSSNEADKLEHQKAHWASCSVDLPKLPTEQCMHYICNTLPNSILRVKGCTQIGDEKDYTFFERLPDGKVHIRPFKGEPITGTKLLTVGPGSERTLLYQVIANSINESSS